MKSSRGNVFNGLVTLVSGVEEKCLFSQRGASSSVGPEIHRANKICSGRQWQRPNKRSEGAPDRKQRANFKTLVEKKEKICYLKWKSGGRSSFF